MGMRESAKTRSESELCGLFAAKARACGFKVYSETGNFDMLLVAGEECRGFKPGDQVGVQAKLYPNVAVLAQSLPRAASEPSPNYYMVLVPKADVLFRRVARALKITVVQGYELLEEPHWNFAHKLWHRFDSGKPCWVPDVEVVDLPAGVRSPRTLNTWKVKAVKLCLHGEKQGYLTAHDFKEFGVSMSRWLDHEWITIGALVLVGRRWRYYYAINHDTRPPHVMHPELARALQEEP
jgi:hypothetical protein